MKNFSIWNLCIPVFIYFFYYYWFIYPHFHWIIHQLCILEYSDTELCVVINSNILLQPQRLLQKSESSPATRPSRRDRKLCLLVWRSLVGRPLLWSGEGRRGVDTRWIQRPLSTTVCSGFPLPSSRMKENTTVKEPTWPECRRYAPSCLFKEV